MGLVSYSTADGGPLPGFRIGDRIIDLSSLTSIDTPGNHGSVAFLSALPEIEGRLWEAGSLEGFCRSEVSLHSPVAPQKVIRLEGCYEHDLTDEGFNPHLEEAGLNELEWPSLWITPASTTIGPGTPVRLPPSISDARPGVELALVIGEEAKSLSVEEALSAVAGCTIAVSVTAFDDLPGLEGYRMFDSFLPFGPEVVPAGGLDLDDLAMGVKVNGRLLDSRTTADFRFSPGEMVAYASKVLTLEPGDLVLTGDPTRIDRPLAAGDRVSSWIESVGTLRNPVEDDG